MLGELVVFWDTTTTSVRTLCTCGASEIHSAGLI